MNVHFLIVYKIRQSKICCVYFNFKKTTPPLSQYIKLFSLQNERFPLNFNIIKTFLKYTTKCYIKSCEIKK